MRTTLFALCAVVTLLGTKDTVRAHPPGWGYASRPYTGGYGGYYGYQPSYGWHGMYGMP
ncbi:MAG: hypothetical protein G01um1014106_199, partial [Parcubacteria group bacterium Gr01-1014_106]